MVGEVEWSCILWEGYYFVFWGEDVDFVWVEIDFQ